MNVLKKIISSRWLPMLVWILVIAVFWEIGATVVETTKRTPENVLPHISQIVEAALSSKPVSSGRTAAAVVLSSAGKTLGRAAMGFLIGTILGFALALIMKLSKITEKIIFPYLMIIQMVPILGMAPIILSITGDINTSRVVIAAILTFYPVATGTLAGFNAVERNKYDLMHSYAAGKFTVYTKVLIPHSIPYFFTGLKIAAPMAITASILVDTLQGDGGLGTMLSQSLKHAMSIYVFWLIVFFGAFVGIFSSKLMGMIEQLVLPHKRIRKVRKEASHECQTKKRKEYFAKIL